MLIKSLVFRDGNFFFFFSLFVLLVFFLIVSCFGMFLCSNDFAFAGGRDDAFWASFFVIGSLDDLGCSDLR